VGVERDKLPRGSETSLVLLQRYTLQRRCSGEISVAMFLNFLSSFFCSFITVPFCQCLPGLSLCAGDKIIFFVLVTFPNLFSISASVLTAFYVQTAVASKGDTSW
jgi:hypothetical protein